MKLGDLDALKAEFDLIASNSATGEWQTIPIKHIKQIIDNAPTVESFEVKNKVCNKCNHATKYEYPFCPWCGADMRGKKNENV